MKIRLARMATSRFDPFAVPGLLFAAGDAGGGGGDADKDADGDADKDADGDKDADADADKDADADADKDGDGADKLGDAGKKALDTMKAQRNAERQKRRVLETQLADLKKPKGDDGPDADSIRSEATKAANTKANERILRSEIKAAAKGVLADAADAFKFLDLTKLDVSDDGEVDEDEIAEQLADLIKSKPYLAAQGGKRFGGSGDGGPRNGGHNKSQLSEADLTSMKPAAIDKARREGRLDTLLGKS